MKCNYCGYELEKPNLKTCPLCGHKVIPGERPSDEDPSLSEPASVETTPETSNTFNPENVNKVTIDFQHDVDKTSEGSTIYPSNESLSRCDEIIQYPPVQNNVQDILYAEPVNKVLESIDPFPKNINTDDEVVPEDPEQYIESGSYQPYSDEADDPVGYNDTPVVKTEKGLSTEIVVTLAALAGLLIGAILYMAIG